MNDAETKRNARLAAMSDRDLLFIVVTVCDEEAIGSVERNAFIDMQKNVERAGRLTKRQRAWVEEAARRVTPIDSREVPRGKEVPTPDVLKNLPKAPPGR